MVNSLVLIAERFYKNILLFERIHRLYLIV